MKVSLLKAVAFTVLQAVYVSAHEAVSTKDIQGVAVGAAEYLAAEGSRRKSVRRIVNDPGRRRGDWWYDVRNYDDCMDICEDETSWSQNKCENKCLDLTGDIARGRNKVRRNSGRRRRRRRNGNDDSYDDDKWEEDDRNRDFDDDGCGPGRAFKRSSSTRSGCKPSASTKRAVKRNRRRRCNGRYCDESEEEDELTETATTVASTTTKASKEDAREARKAEREANRGSKSTKSPSMEREEDELTETATTVASTTTKASKEDAREARKAEREARKAEREANRGSKSTKSPSAFESAIA